MKQALYGCINVIASTQSIMTASQMRYSFECGSIVVSLIQCTNPLRFSCSIIYHHQLSLVMRGLVM